MSEHVPNTKLGAGFSVALAYHGKLAFLQNVLKIYIIYMIYIISSMLYSYIDNLSAVHRKM